MNSSEKESSFAASVARSAAETLDRLIYESHTHDVNPLQRQSATEMYGLRHLPNLPIFLALSKYARNSHVPMLEGETIEGWYKRVAPLLNYPKAANFGRLLKVIVAQAVGVRVDDLDDLINGPATPAPYPPTWPQPIRGSVTGKAQSTTPPPPPPLDVQRKQFDEGKKAAGWKGSNALPYDSEVD